VTKSAVGLILAALVAGDSPDPATPPEAPCAANEAVLPVTIWVGDVEWGLIFCGNLETNDENGIPKQWVLKYYVPLDLNVRQESL